MSGRESLKIARKLFRPLSRDGPGGSDGWSPEPRRVYLGIVVSVRDAHPLDEACLTFFPSPHSYTREDVCELSCHGGPRLLDMILENALEAGARLAEPGEFTLRAYLGGRIDITRAEAINDLIQAESESEVRLAADQLQGRLFDLIGGLRESLLELIAEGEASLEFVDEAEEFPTRQRWIGGLSDLEGRIRETVGTFHRGRRIREGIPVAVVGHPNVGKSTIFNNLVGSSRAIVTDEPGTTRDVISESVEMQGVRLRFLDTAGMRQASGGAEREGILRARKTAAEAGLILFVMDLGRDATPEEADFLAELDPAKVIPVLNKKDLLDGNRTSLPRLPQFSRPALQISALHGDGMEELRDEILKVGLGDPPETGDRVMIANLRHRDLLEKTADRLAQARQAADGGATEEYLLEDLHAALRFLGEIVGEVTIEDVYDKIFSRFCIGK